MPVARRPSLWIASSAVALVLAAALGVGLGPNGWSWNQTWSILWNVRMPRVALAALIGAMLSVAGGAYQGVFRNPLVDPYLLGVAAGAGLGATVMFALGADRFASWPVSPVPFVAFASGLIAVGLAYLIGARFGNGLGPSTGLVLAGVAVSAFFTAVQTYVLYRNIEVVREVYAWILGRLTTASWSEVRLVLPYVLVMCTVILLHARQLDVFRVGDDEARALGVDVARTRLILVVAATLGTAAAVSVSGLIGFVGVVVPHVVRLVAGTSYRVILPVSMFAGAAFTILCDLAGRTLIRPAELPIGVVTAFVGAPFFLLVLGRRRGGEAM